MAAKADKLHWASAQGSVTVLFVLQAQEGTAGTVDRVHAGDCTAVAEALHEGELACAAATCLIVQRHLIALGMIHELHALQSSQVRDPRPPAAEEGLKNWVHWRRGC